MPQYERLFTADDIAQEMELVRLTKGKKASKAIVKAKGWRQALDHPNLDSEDPDEGFFASLQVEYVPTAAEELLAWALEQGPDVRNLIERFLASPDQDELLPIVLESLSREGVELQEISMFPAPRETKTYTDIMFEALPASKDELITLMSRFPIKRPASTVRQFLRRNEPSLYQNERGEYCRRPVD